MQNTGREKLKDSARSFQFRLLFILRNFVKFPLAGTDIFRLFRKRSSIARGGGRYDLHFAPIAKETLTSMLLLLPLLLLLLLTHGRCQQLSSRRLPYTSPGLYNNPSARFHRFPSVGWWVVVGFLHPPPSHYAIRILTDPVSSPSVYYSFGILTAR